MGVRPGPRRDVRRAFWEQIRAGHLREEAGLLVGVGPYTGSRWFRQAGGVAPSDIYALPSGSYLGLAEREEILVGVERGWSIRAIARSVNRSPSTVFRELRRNMRHQYRTRSRLDPTQPGGPRTRPWDYRPSLAQQRADHRARRPKVARLAGKRLGDFGLPPGQLAAGHARVDHVVHHIIHFAAKGIEGGDGGAFCRWQKQKGVIEAAARSGGFLLDVVLWRHGAIVTSTGTANPAETSLTQPAGPVRPALAVPGP